MSDLVRKKIKDQNFQYGFKHILESPSFCDGKHTPSGFMVARYSLTINKYYQEGEVVAEYSFWSQMALFFGLLTSRNELFLAALMGDKSN